MISIISSPLKPNGKAVAKDGINSHARGSATSVVYIKSVHERVPMPL